jgi:hypothetical protein
MIHMPTLHRFLREEFDLEERSGFALAKRIPDMRVKHFLDYYASLPPNERDELAHACSLRGAVWISGEEGARHLDTVNALSAWQGWLHESMAGVGRDPHYYHSVQDLRGYVAQAKADLARGCRLSVPQEMVDYANTVHGIKTAELRKRLRPAMKALFGPGLIAISNRSGEYQGWLSGSAVRVCLDFGSQYFQLGYQVDVQSSDPAGRLRHAGYEMALGIGHGHWNFLVEENVADSIALLGDFVRYVAELPR